MDFHTHRLHFWHVINALTPYEDADEDADAIAAEIYSEIYSDY